ncbi:uncharacterized protein [Argopecten irradians]|uniref:uncharacterized protein n=1 Tax=Argopecten irradians TaxID=31199 RepID=UPI0037125192
MDEFMAGDPAVRPKSLVSSIEETSSEQQTPAKEKTTPPKKKRKKREAEMPDWFREYSEEQNKILNEIKDNQERGARVAEERNSILKSLTCALLKTQLPNISES